MKERREYAAMDVGALVNKEIPSEWFGEALPLVRNLMTSELSTTEKREYLVGVLMRTLHIEEFRARLLIELAVMWLKLAPKEP